MRNSNLKMSVKAIDLICIVRNYNHLIIREIVVLLETCKLHHLILT